MSKPLAVLLAHLVAGGAGVSVVADLDALEAAVATPPARADVPLLKPLLGGLGALLGQVLLVEVAQVVPQAFRPVEGVLVARASLVVAVELLLVLVADVHRLVVPVQVGHPFEGHVAAVGRQAYVLSAVAGAAGTFEGRAGGVGRRLG